MNWKLLAVTAMLDSLWKNNSTILVIMGEQIILNDTICIEYRDIFNQPRGLLLGYPKLKMGNFKSCLILRSKPLYRLPYWIIFNKEMYKILISIFEGVRLIRDLHSLFIVLLLFVLQLQGPDGSKH
jgi:hypothetical protein